MVFIFLQRFDWQRVEVDLRSISAVAKEEGLYTCISPSGPMGGGLTNVGGMPLSSRGSTRCSRNARRSLAGSLTVRVLALGGAAFTTEPASEDLESSWNVVGLIFRRDISARKLTSFKFQTASLSLSSPNPSLGPDDRPW
jgi:hypothetical protein